MSVTFIKPTKQTLKEGLTVLGIALLGAVAIYLYMQIQMNTAIATEALEKVTKLQQTSVVLEKDVKAIKDQLIKP